MLKVITAMKLSFCFLSLDFVNPCILYTKELYILKCQQISVLASSSSSSYFEMSVRIVKPPFCQATFLHLYLFFHQIILR